MEAFLTILIGIFIFFWLLSRFGPLLLVKWLQKKAGKFSEEQNSAFRRNGEPYREGETVVSSPADKEKIVGKNVGEYVEYTESEEKGEK